jgi:Xaa-Pro aminopeptidase
MIRERVEKLRALMKDRGVQAYIVPSTDPHQSEYVPELWQRRGFISGFNGSAGDVVVTETAAGLWTDSRYFLQAGKQLDPDVYDLFKLGMPGVPFYKDWLATNLKPGQKVGVDPRLLSYKEYGDLKARLEKKGVQLAPVSENLVDLIWTDRPAGRSDPAFAQDVRYSGESVESKLSRVREKMAAEGADAHVVAALDSLAWLFNIRGRDVDYNPCVIGYAIVTADAATLYIDPAKVDDALAKHLGSTVTVEPYDAFEDGLAALNKSGSTVWLDTGTCSQWVVECLLPGAKPVFSTSPIALFQACKNDVEVEGSREAHKRDGVAMVRLFMWLEKEVKAGKVTELAISKKLIELRSRSDLFRGPSFETIAGYKGNGAIIHYAPTSESDAVVKEEGILLIDSGGQYLDGTTDITRTVAMSAPTDEQKDRFTRVLKGVIASTRQPFPEGTAGRQIDALGRTALWDAGLNFLHGVGHGVGSYLGVHEGPQAISFYRCTGVALEPGMICSIEPGYYKEGEFGIRTENLVVVREAPDLAVDGINFRRFETLTLCPIDLALVDRNLLDTAEIAWLNDYHRTVRETLIPLLEADEAAWLADATAEL